MQVIRCSYLMLLCAILLEFLFANKNCIAQVPSSGILNTYCYWSTYHNGYFYGAGYYQQIYKFDTAGNVLWQKRIGGDPFNPNLLHDNIQRIYVVTENGQDYLLCMGKSNSWSLPFPGGLSETYMYKTDTSGSLIWAKKYRGVNVIGMVVDIDSNYVLPIRDGYNPIMKVDKDTGQPIWTKENSYFINGLNAISNVYIYKAGNSFYATGVVAPVGPVIFMLMKTDSIGTALWVKAYGDSIPNACWASYQCHDGGYILVGNSAPSAVSYNDFLVIRTDANGDTLWCRRYDNDGWTDSAYDVIQTSDNGFVVCGRTNPIGGGVNDSRGLLLKIDSLGNIKWAKSHSGNTFVWSLQELPNGGFTFTSGSKTHITDSLGNNCISEDDTLTMGYPQINITNVSVASQAGASTNASPAVQINSFPLVITDYCASLGANNISTTQAVVDIMPNPAINFVTVISASTVIKEITIRSLTGQIILQQQHYQNNATINVSKFNNGIYFIDVLTTDGYARKKVVKL